jgi:hypothetical protein
MWGIAAKRAIEVNPRNRLPIENYISAKDRPMILPDKLSVLTQKYWKHGLGTLTVGFTDAPSRNLMTKILSHMNAWGASANVDFQFSQTDPQVRIAREPDQGNWSYLGTDVLVIPQSRPTMNLDSFTEATPDSEFFRVVRHEAGHTLGFPHEHMRRELIDRLDFNKVIDYYAATEGWTKEETLSQVLLPLEESSIFGTPTPDEESIMCYQIPGTITKDGYPILGGMDISKVDYEFAATVYPKA